MTLRENSNNFARRTNWDLRPTLLSLDIERARASGRRIIDLTCTNPTLSGFDLSWFRNGAEGMAPSEPYRPDAQGLLSARQAVARYYADMGYTVDPAHIFLTASTSEAYSFLFRLLADNGDRFAVPTPSYPLLDFLADLSDVSLVRYPLHYDDRWWLDLDALKGVCAEGLRGIVTIGPNNPTGSILTSIERDELVTLAAGVGLAVIADEVFLDYCLEKQAASFVDETRVLTFTLSGVSKILAMPDMKLAWIVVSGPDSLVAQACERLRIIGDTFLSVAAPIQHALPLWLSNRQRVQGSIRSRLKENLSALQSTFGADCLHVSGGWSAVVRLPVLVPSDTFCRALLEEQGVLADPGHLFGLPDAGSLVLSLLTPPEDLAAGMDAICVSIERLLNA